MITSFKPLLAASPWKAKSNPTDEQKYQSLSKLVYPVFATPKFDGIRATTLDNVPRPGQYSVPVCRSLDIIPNDHIRNLMAQLPPGCDGELVTYDSPDLFTKGMGNEISKAQPINKVQSSVMTYGGKPEFRFFMFDWFHFGQQNVGYVRRCARMSYEPWPSFVITVLPVRCENVEELMAYYAKCLSMGYEGICFRTPDSPPWKMTSKDGRSSLREQWLVKMKHFDKSEAVIIGSYEEMANNNPITYNKKGLAERSSHNDKLFGKNTLGGFIVRGEDGIEHRVGGGFNSSQRKEFWEKRDEYVGKIIQYIHQPYGAKDAPRISIFCGFRDARDM